MEGRLAKIRTRRPLVGLYQWGKVYEEDVENS
jgi:hypothetical protein